MEKGDNDLEKIIEDLKSKVKDLEEINNGSNYRIADLENMKSLTKGTWQNLLDFVRPL